MTMRKTLISLVTALVLILAAGTALAQDEWWVKIVRLESINLPGLFIRHSNFEAFLTKVESDLDKNDSAFFEYPAINGGPGVSFESVNFPGRMLRHRNFRLVLEPDDGTPLFADDASFLPTPGPAGATGFEASNFPGHFIRHKNFMLYVDKNEDSELFRADSGFMVRSADDVGIPIKSRQHCVRGSITSALRSPRPSIGSRGEPRNSREIEVSGELTIRGPRSRRM